METEPPPPFSTQTQTISIRTLTGQIIPIQLPLDPALTVGNLKYAIEQEKGIPADHQRLIFRGAELQDGSTLASVGIEHECAVHLLLRRVEQDPSANQTGVDYGAVGQQGMIPVAIPIHDQNMMPLPMILPQHERLMQIHRLSRAVRLFAIIDGIFLLIFALSYWLLALAIILPICGYYGAQHYRRCYIYLYMLYLVGNVALRIYLIVTQSTAVVWVLIFIVGIMIELYIMRIVWIFDKMIKDLTDEEKRQLLLLQNPHRRLF